MMGWDRVNITIHDTCTVGSSYGRLQESCSCWMNGAPPAHWLFAEPDVTPTAATGLIGEGL